jgi:hypothetical protein
MPTSKRVICLANSRKLSGRCIAGIELESDRPPSWIRPISARPHQEVSERERQYFDGSDPRVLDVLDLPLLEHHPSQFQQENWLLDPERYWARRGTFPVTDLGRFAESAGPLWVNGAATYHGKNDEIPLATANTLQSSLKLIFVERLALSVFQPGLNFGDPKRRVQARFRFSGVDYALWVTDPVIERAYLARPDAVHELGASYLTVSIGEPYNDKCYKLVAAIIPVT